MGAGASSSPLPTTVEEALAAGHSQAEIDAYMAEHPLWQQEQIDDALSQLEDVEEGLDRVLTHSLI